MSLIIILNDKFRNYMCIPNSYIICFLQSSFSFKLLSTSSEVQWNASIFSNFVACSFILLIDSFAVQKSVSLLQCQTLLFNTDVIWDNRKIIAYTDVKGNFT